MIVFALLLVLSITAIEAGKHDIYSGNKVYSVSFRDKSEQELLGKLEYDLDLDVWQRGVPGLRDLHVMTTPQNEGALLDWLKRYGIQHKVYLDNLARFLEEFDNKMLRFKTSRSVRQPFEDYPRLDEIYAYMDKLAADYPELVTVVTVGESFEGRPIKYMTISTTYFQDQTKPIFFMEATLHAREWVTPPVALYSAHRLLEDLRDEETDLLEDYDWIIWPVVNPDGYEYTHTDERLWRKTRSVLEVDTECLGVDANRNFDVAFNTTGVSTNPCSNTYPGARQFSEPETAYVRDVLFEYLPRIQMFYDIHSHGNYLLYGYGEGSLPPNAATLNFIASLMGATMDLSKIDESDYYLVGNSGLCLYPTSGTAQDYAQVIGVPFSYTLELPGYGYTFLPGPEYIPHFTEESWRGIVAGARVAKLLYKGPIAL